jgi:hypothetical protein
MIASSSALIGTQVLAALALCRVQEANARVSLVALLWQSLQGFNQELKRRSRWSALRVLACLAQRAESTKQQDLGRVSSLVERAPPLRAPMQTTHSIAKRP